MGLLSSLKQAPISLDRRGGEDGATEAPPE